MITFALAVLASCSDLFPPDWTATANSWTGGLRGLPAALTASAEGLHFRSIGPGDGPQFYEDDMLRTLPRPITRAENPFIVLRVNFPPFETWPTGLNNTGNRMYLRFRLTAVDQYGRNYWPGFFIGRSVSGTPYFAYRTLVDHILLAPIPQAGPWTLGIGFDETGLIEFYAAPGYVALAASDMLSKAPEEYPQFMQTVNQLFLQISNDVTAPGLSEPDWVLNRLSVFAALPRLDVSAAGLSCNGYPGATYTLERSAGLDAWEIERTFVASLNMPASDGFYRLTQ